MIQVEHISQMASLLVQTALNRRTIGYQQIYSCMNDKKYSKEDRKDTLNAANRALSDFRHAIYSAVLAENTSGLPLDWFYGVFKNRHSEEYKEIAGDKEATKLSPEEKRRITEIERERVYAHAEEKFSVEPDEEEDE